MAHVMNKTALDCPRTSAVGCLQTRQLLPVQDQGPCPSLGSGEEYDPPPWMVPGPPGLAVSIWAGEAKRMFFCPDVND